MIRFVKECKQLLSVIDLYVECHGVTGDKSRNRITEGLLCCSSECGLYSEDEEKLLNDFKQYVKCHGKSFRVCQD